MLRGSGVAWDLLKTQPYDVYNEAGKARLAYRDHGHDDVETFDSLNVWFETTYIKNTGKYADTTADGDRILKITDEFISPTLSLTIGPYKVSKRVVYHKLSIYLNE